MNTTVINLHRKPTPYYDIYIGQRIRFHPNKYPQSKWGNQFTKRYDSIPTRIQLYAEWIQTQPHLLAALPELRGKILGCWCVEEPIDYVRKDKVCHGEVLLQLIKKKTSRARCN